MIFYGPGTVVGSFSLSRQQATEGLRAISTRTVPYSSVKAYTYSITVPILPSHALEFCPKVLYPRTRTIPGYFASAIVCFSSISHLLSMLSTYDSERNFEMDPLNNPIQRLRLHISSLEALLTDLKVQLTNAEANYNHTAPTLLDAKGSPQTQPKTYDSDQPVDRKGKTFASLVDQLDLPQKNKWAKSWDLTSEEYKRYGRQLIMPEIGLRGGLSSLKYDGWPSLTPIGSRTAAT